MKKFLAMAAALTMSLSVAAAASAEKYQMTFSTAVSQEQSSTIYMDKALDLITERTNGDVTFSRTYSGTLGSEHDLGVMCQSGLAQGARRRAGRDLRDDLQPGVQGHPEQEPRCVFHR